MLSHGPVHSGSSESVTPSLSLSSQSPQSKSFPWQVACWHVCDGNPPLPAAFTPPAVAPPVLAAAPPLPALAAWLRPTSTFSVQLKTERLANQPKTTAPVRNFLTAHPRYHLGDASSTMRWCAEPGKAFENPFAR